MRHGVVNVGPSTPHLSSSPIAPPVITPDVFDDSVMDSSRVAWQLHLSWVEQSFLERFQTEWSLVRNLSPWHSMATGKHYQLFDAKPHSFLPFKRVGEHLSFNLKDSTSASSQQHAGPCHATMTYTCQPQVRTTITVKTSVTHIALSFAVMATSTSHCEELMDLQ